MRRAAPILAFVLTLTTNALAGEPRVHDELGSAFRYTTPARRTYLRAGVEEVVVLGVGFAQYASNKAGNEADWDLAPKWSSVEAKLQFSAVTFDNNYFDTNWLTHPVAGYFYYSAARGNRLSIGTSVAITFGASALWEYVGELREHAAINDLIATPLTGISLGEPMLQLGALFRRSRPSPLAIGGAWLFAPFASAHAALDGLEAAPSERFDRNGLPADVWHRLSLGASVGVTRQARGLTQEDVGVAASSRIVGLPGYADGTRCRGWFDGGEVSSIDVRARVARESLVDLLVRTHFVALGWSAQSERGGTYTGLDVGAEYGRHDWDRDRRRARDRIAMATLGLTHESRVLHEGWTLRARADVLASFAGVDAYALPESRRVVPSTDGRLTSVLREKRYYHAAGAVVRPRVEVERAATDAGLGLEADWFTAITARDVVVTTAPRRSASDRRLRATAWLGVRISPSVRLSLSLAWGERSGSVGSSHAARSELGATTGAELVF